MLAWKRGEPLPNGIEASLMTDMVICFFLVMEPLASAMTLLQGETASYMGNLIPTIWA